LPCTITSVTLKRLSSICGSYERMHMWKVETGHNKHSNTGWLLGSYTVQWSNVLNLAAVYCLQVQGHWTAAGWW
jgi:hypothetical protein